MCVLHTHIKLKLCKNYFVSFHSIQSIHSLHLIGIQVFLLLQRAYRFSYSNALEEIRSKMLKLNRAAHLSKLVSLHTTFTRNIGSGSVIKSNCDVDSQSFKVNFKSYQTVLFSNRFCLSDC